MISEIGKIFGRFHRDEGGQTMVFVLVLFFFLLLLASAGIDFIQFLPRKIHVQQAVDAGAMTVSYWQARGVVLLGLTNVCRVVTIVLCAIPFTYAIGEAINQVLNLIVDLIREGFPILGLLDAQIVAKANGASALSDVLEGLDSDFWNVIGEIVGFIEYLTGGITMLPLGKVGEDGTFLGDYIPTTGTDVLDLGFCSEKIVYYTSLWNDDPGPPVVGISWIAPIKGQAMTVFGKKLPACIAFGQSYIEKTGIEYEYVPLLPDTKTIKLQKVNFEKADALSVGDLLSHLNDYIKH